MPQLRRPVSLIEVDEPRTADYTIFTLQNGYPGQGGSRLFIPQGRLHPSTQVVWCLHTREHVAPDALVVGDLFQASQMCLGHRLKSDPDAIKCGSGDHAW